MTDREFELILVEGIIHTPETRAEFYLNEARKRSCTITSLFSGLYNAYKRIEKTVNEKDFTSWTTSNPDGTGNKTYFKKQINLMHVSGGRISGHISDKNITDLLLPIEQIGKMAQKFSSESRGYSAQVGKGFVCNLTVDQIQLLYNKMHSIYFEATLENFNAIFCNEVLPQNFSIKWIRTNVLLAYFIKKVFHKENHLNVWKTAEYIFNKKNLRQSENNPYPKGHESLDKILGKLYTPLQ